jgi:tetratricopeptide (TPR) repeat protein
MDGDRNLMTMASLKDWVLEAMRQNRFAEAEKTLRGALEAPAQGADLRFLLGTVLAASGKIDEAIQYLEEVRKLAPDNVSLLNNLGNVLRLKGRAEEAVTHLRHALTIQPDSPDALTNLGLALSMLGRADQAVQCGRLALRLRPQDAEALFMLASALSEEGRYDEATHCFEQVLNLRPGHPAALNGLALAMREQGKLDESIDELRKALTAAPEDPTLHTNLGLCLMEQGDLAGGAGEYEWRLRRPGAPRLNAPLWDGKPLAGRTLLLWADTGYADGIQMLRFAALLRSSAARIVLACPAPMAKLAATVPGLDHVVPNGEPTPPVHAYLPLASLLNRLNVAPETIPSHGAYLAVDPSRVAALKPMLNGGGFKVGLVWNSNQKERRRSVPLAALAPLLAVPGVRFFSLDQAGSNDLAASPLAGRIVDISPKLTELADMAAAISQLDLVITADNVAAHIAGALGRSAWVMLSAVCEWRWSHDRTDSPWYPSLLLFRQTQGEGWERVVEQIAGALAVFGNTAGTGESEAPVALPPAQTTAAGASFLAALRQYRAVGAMDQLVSTLALQPNSPDLLFRLGAIFAEAGRAEGQDYLLRLRRLAFDPAQIVSLTGLAQTSDELKIGLAWSGHETALNALLDVPGLSFFSLTARSANDRIIDLSAELTDFYRYAAALRTLDLVITTDISIAHLASALDRPAWLFLPATAEAGWITRVSTMPCYTQLRVFWPEEGRDEQSAVHRLVGEVAQRVLVGDRDHRAETLNNLGVILRRFGQLDAAIVCYRRALAKRADYPLALGNLGGALQEQGNIEEAIACLVKALELKPGSADGHNNLAVALDGAGITDQAVLHYRHALSLKPDHPQALANLGNIERVAGRLDEAETLERHALDVKPNYPEALAYLGATLRLKGDTDGGIECFRRAIATRSDYPAAHMGLAMGLMAKGDLRTGSAEYEWRWHGWRGATLPSFNAPMWDGQVLGDKTLLLWSEQGLSETLQFIRFAPLLRSFASRIILACPPALVRLMTTAPGIDGVVPLGENLPPFDAHLPLMSVMNRLGTTLTSIPSSMPYLATDSARVQALSGLISGETIRIGLSWGSDSESTDGGERSIRLDAMRQILSMRGVSFFSLQRGQAAAELPNSGFADRIVDVTPYLADAADAAAAISLMDLVIAVDGTVAHLAGALDKNTWLMLPHCADWRWFEKRTDTPWYRSTLLFRQPSPGDWASVVEQAAFALAAGTTPAPAMQIA